MINNYRKLDSCATCIHRIIEYNDYPPFLNLLQDPFCNLDGTWFDIENYQTARDEEILKKNEWNDTHLVHFNGICDDFFSIK